ncbi:MAG: hypothetical protein JWN04_845 [Myxococcaceae bacterium]|nr:hypothetical protein [Myxococcaceae bacterium]
MTEPLQLTTFEYDQRLPGIGLRLPARMTVLPLASGELALVSPIPIDDAMAVALSALGEVRFLIAPNLLHHLYLGAASRRYPNAQVLAPSALRAKQPDLRIDGTLDDDLPAQLAEALEVVRIEGAPSLDEHVFFHRATRSLVVTELVFNVLHPRGLAAHILLFAVGCHGRLAQSRAFRLFIKDRAAASRSVERVLALPTETLIVAHGEIVRVDAREKLTEALRWLLPASRRELPAAS